MIKAGDVSLAMVRSVAERLGPLRQKGGRVKSLFDSFDAFCVEFRKILPILTLAFCHM